MPNAYFERKLVDAAHTAQLFHKVAHVPHGFLRQASYAHEPSGADFSEAWYAAGFNSVKITHGCPSVRVRRHQANVREAGPSLTADAVPADAAEEADGHVRGTPKSYVPLRGRNSFTFLV
jgi:hypothetical protein